MKILTGKQIREADIYTIEHEPVESIELMERAAETVAQAICNRVGQGSNLLFFIGKGNNGGDGLAAARMLSRVGFDCAVCMVFGTDNLSEECHLNYERLPENVKNVSLSEFQVTEDTVIIDAILGSGFTGELYGTVRDVIELINSIPCMVISIDLPSGMKTEYGNDPSAIVHADVTLTIEFPKLAMMLPEAGDCCGEIEVLPIELSTDHAITAFHYTEKSEIETLVKPRLKFSHKGDYGHALLVCGSRRMAGAAILSASAALRSGCGLLTVHTPDSQSSAIFANVPSAMLSPDPGDYFTMMPAELDKYSAIGIGCGLGIADETAKALEELMRIYQKPMVIDADALNIIASNNHIRSMIPPKSILTPHPGEFERLIGKWNGEEEKLHKLQEFAKELQATIVLKGAYTAICTAGGEVFFNSTGTPAMAKGGSGDILTGLLTGLLAAGYQSFDAARLGVWLHGRAGEKAADYYSPEGMNSADLVDFIAEAWSEI